MTDNRVETTVLVLTSENGELYAIPQEALEQYRVSDEQRADLEQQWGDEVSGYSMYQSYLTERTTAYKRAEMRQHSEEIRHKADLAHMATDGDASMEGSKKNAAGEPQGVRRLFSGVLATLRLAPARVTKEP